MTATTKPNLTPLRRFVEFHRDVGAKLQDTAVAGKKNKIFRATLRVILARSQKQSKATLQMLDSGNWEVAALIARAVWEDTAVLGYIHAKDGQRKQFAALYALSFALQQKRMLEELEKCGEIDPSLYRSDRVLLQKRVDRFERLRADLWDRKNENGEPVGMRATWNGLTIRQTFEQASSLSPYSYVMYYMSLCQFVHSDSFVFSSEAYATELGPTEPQTEARNMGMVALRLLLALWHQLLYVTDMVRMTPATDLPSLEEVRCMINEMCASAGMTKAPLVSSRQ